MTICLYCKLEIANKLNWNNLIVVDEESLICKKCLDQFEHLNTNHCNRCACISDLEICKDCVDWQDLFSGDDPLEKNYSLFKYNKMAKEFLARWKYRGDYVLIKALKKEIDSFIYNNSEIFNEKPLIIPIPLSNERLYERAFNQSEAIASYFGEYEVLLSRIDGEKQSKKTKMDRLNSINPFILNKKVNRKVILIDDIYTTGMTLRHAATLLKESGSTKVISFTLIRG